ncbi:MAG: hypothetical protein A4E66_00163 [Syntrophus sp. PtaB.Bin001]|nr:MAG: hypothetical protein A4E66_00163 [Syntrophus sp. PtaB.Bin001]
MELYIGKQHGEIGLENAEALMAQYPQYAKRALTSAIRSESWRLKNVIRDTIRGNGPGGSWPGLNPHTGVLNKAAKGWVKNYRKSRYRFTAKGTIKYKKAVNIYRDRMLSTKTRALQKLAGGTRYTYDNDLMVSEIGFLSGRSPGATTVLAKKHAQGFNVPVTPRSRRWAFALGFPLKKGTSLLNIPARPVVGPVFEKEKGRIVQNINKKVPEKIMEYIQKAGRA